MDDLDGAPGGGVVFLLGVDSHGPQYAGRDVAGGGLMAALCFEPVGAGWLAPVAMARAHRTTSTNNRNPNRAIPTGREI